MEQMGEQTTHLVAAFEIHPGRADGQGTIGAGVAVAAKARAAQTSPVATAGGDSCPKREVAKETTETRDERPEETLTGFHRE